MPLDRTKNIVKVFAVPHSVNRQIAALSEAHGTGPESRMLREILFAGLEVMKSKYPLDRPIEGSTQKEAAAA